MNKYDFLSRLRNALSPLPQEERDAAMNYYEEFFSEAGAENEQSVIASLGSPEELAKSIIDENNRDNPFASSENPDTSANAASGFDSNPGYSANGSYTGANPQQAKWTNGQIALFIVLLVLSSPIWLGVLSAMVGVIVGLFAAVIGIIAAFGGCAVGFFAAGATALFSEPAVGLLLMGLSFVFIGLFPVAIVPMCQGVVKLTKLCAKGIGSLFNKITGGKGTVRQ